MVTPVLLFEAVGMLLNSGCAMLPVMDAVSALLPANQRAEFQGIRQEIKEDAPLLALPLERLDFIPRYAKKIAGLGQMKGILESSLRDGAMLLEQELDYRLEGVL